MKYVPKNQQSTIQELLYPRPRIPMNFYHHKQNLLLIKETQEKNRQLHEEIDNYVEPTPYKLKQFTEIPSALEQKTKEWIKKEAEMRRLPPKPKTDLPQPNKKYVSPYYNPESLRAHSQESLFEKYYAAKLKKLEQDKRKRSHNISREISHKQIEVTNNISQEDEKANPNIHGIRPVKKEHNKSPLPKPNERSLILPKINHNYLYENRKIISEGKVPKKYHMKEENKPQYHKDFGKTPEYLAQYKLEEERRKEYEKLKEEEKTYPKGTRLVPEQERLKTLQDLIQAKQEIERSLEKMPITMRSLAVQNKKAELESKMDELNKAIELFSKKRVFVREQ